MQVLILHTIIAISILGTLSAFILYVVDQKFKVDEYPAASEIAPTFAQAIDDAIRDHADASSSASITSVPCIRCARCVFVCPARLEPYLLMHLSKKQLWQRAEQEHVAKCTECGCCNEACPANLPLLEYIGHARKVAMRDKTVRK